MEIKLNAQTYPIDIVMVTWYRPELTRLAIKTIAKNTKREHYRLTVIDNASPMEMVRDLRAMARTGLIDHLLLNATNKGLEPARNQGLRLTKSYYCVTTDNDCLPPKMVDGKDWLERLVELMESNPDYAAISCRTPIMIGTGNIFEDESKDITEFPWPGGSLRIMDTTAVLDAGGWRDEVNSRGSEEKHICGRLRELGWKTGFATHIVTLHLFGDLDTDRWGYDKNWKPEDSGHSDVWHPKFGQGDDEQEIAQYA